MMVFRVFGCQGLEHSFARCDQEDLQKLQKKLTRVDAVADVAMKGHGIVLVLGGEDIFVLWVAEVESDQADIDQLSQGHSDGERQ